MVGSGILQPVSSEDDLAVGIAAELVLLAKRTIDEALGAPDKDPLEIPNLCRIAQKLHPDEWNDKPTDALTLLMKRAVEALGDDAPLRTTLTYRELGWGIYNLDGESLKYVDGKKHDKLLEKTYLRAGLTPPFGRTKGRHTHLLRERLAEILLSLEHEATATLEKTDAITQQIEAGSRRLVEAIGSVYEEEQTATTVVSGASRDGSQRLPAMKAPPNRDWRDRLPQWANEYVPRHTYHQQIHELATTRRRVALLGLPGFGKTRLACEAAIEMADAVGGEVIWLRGDSEATLLADMSAEIAARGGSARDEYQTRQGFAAIIQPSTTAVRVVVIDNIEHADVIDRLLPRSPSSVLLVTVRQRLLDDNLWPYLEVGDMAVEEAIGLIRSLFYAHIQEDEARQLAEALAGYPLAILHAAALLGSGDTMSVDEFCRVLAQDAARVFDTKVRRERALTFIYKSLLARLEQEHEQAADLLKAIVRLRLTQTPRSLIREIFEAIPDYRSETSSERYDRLEFLKTIETLEDYVLISRSDKDLSIHQVVHAILRSLGAGQNSYVDSAVVVTLDRMFRRLPGRGPSEVRDWLPTITELIRVADGRGLSDEETLQLGELLTTALVGVATAGDKGTFGELRRSWLFQKVMTGGGLKDRALAYVRYDWLRLSDGEYDPLALTGVEKDLNDSLPLSFGRKVSIAERGKRTGNEYLHELSVSLERSQTVRVVEPLHHEFRRALHVLATGQNHKARGHALTAIRDAGDDHTRVAAHLLLARIALRQLDINDAKHHHQNASDQLSAAEVTGMSRLLRTGRVAQVAGDIAHLEFVLGMGDVLSARREYKKARESYWCEAIPVGRLEVERKLACALTHSASQQGAARLRNLLLDTGVPLHLPVNHRARLSLAKIGVLRGEVTTVDLDHCWLAADFYASSLASDRYWYVEALLTAYVAGLSCAAPEAEQALLYETIVRDARAIGREDKIIFMLAARNGAADFSRLLAD